MSADVRAAVVAPLPPIGMELGSLSMGEALFVLTAFVAPIEVLLVQSFTLYDLLISALFVLTWSRGRLPIPPAPILVPGLLFLLFALLSTLRAPHPQESLTQVLQYVFILFVLLPTIFVFVRSRPVLRASLLAFGLGSLFGIGLAFLSPETAWSNRVSAFFTESPNRLGYPGAYLGPFACLFLIECMRRRRLLPLLGALGAGYLLLWSLAASGSRGATAGTVVALILFLVCRRGIALEWQSLLRLAAAALVVVALGTLLTRADLFPSTLSQRIERTLQAEETLVQDRTTLALAGLRAFADSPVLGIGLDNFRYVSDRYLPTVTQQLPHNLWIQLLAHTGLFGALSFLGMIVGWYRILLRAAGRARDRADRELLWAFLAAQSAVMTIFLFLPVLIQRQYWLLFGLGLAAAGLVRGSRPPSSLRSPVEETVAP